MIEPIEKNITVPCNPQAAFDVFVRQMGNWWPGAEHSVAAMGGTVPQKIILEPKTGGRIYEVSDKGEEIDWGSIKQLEDGQRIVMNWHINTPEAQATEVDVTFTARDDGHTDVTLVHRNFEAMGENGPSMRDGYNKGWVNVFENHFAKACAG